MKTSVYIYIYIIKTSSNRYTNHEHLILNPINCAHTPNNSGRKGVHIPNTQTQNPTTKIPPGQRPIIRGFARMAQPSRGATFPGSKRDIVAGWIFSKFICIYDGI